jgi:hypothetical protein
LNARRPALPRKRKASADTATARAGSVAATLTALPITSKRSSVPNGPVIARPQCAFTTTRESQPFAAHHASISR